MLPKNRLSKIKQLLKEKTQNSPKSQPLFWKPAGLIQRISPSKKVQQWLSTQGSLTKKLRLLCPDLEVIVLSEKGEIPLTNEALSLKLKTNESAWIRCVLLKGGGGENWVYARTVIPNFSENNPWAHLQALGNQPLGDVLFQKNTQNNQIRRTPFTFSKQNLTTWPYLHNQLTQSLPQKIGYARRSVFTQQQAPLLLTEVFLPELLEHNKI